MEKAAQTRMERTAEPAGPAQAAPPGLLWEVSSLSDVGRVRSENQDACGEARDDEGNLLLIVADGMGGHQGGSTASRLCIEAACREFRSSHSPLDERMRRALELANVEVHEAAGRDAGLEGMGTTSVAIAIAPDGAAFVAWVGDSRGYRLRDGRLERISEDHSWVAEAVRMGAITAEEAETHPRKNQLLRCIGADPQVEVDVRPLDVRAGDRFLLCSDGLWGELPEPDLAAVLGYEDPPSAVRTLVDRANDHGGPDNITVQILWIRDAASAASSAAPARQEPARPRRLVRLIAAVGIVSLALVGMGGYAALYCGGAFFQPGPGSAEPAAGSAAALEPRIESFLESWALAVTTVDYELYRGLGLPESGEQFERRYAGHTGVLMTMELLDHEAGSDGLVRARVRMSYGYDASSSRRELKAEYQLRLRDTDARLRYAGGFD